MRSLWEDAFFVFVGALLIKNGAFWGALSQETMREGKYARSGYCFFVRHSSAFGALPLEKLIEEKRFICALCESLIQRMATSFLLTIVLWSSFNFHADNQGVLLLSNFQIV